MFTGAYLIGPWAEDLYLETIRLDTYIIRDITALSHGMSFGVWGLQMCCLCVICAIFAILVCAFYVVCALFLSVCVCVYVWSSPVPALPPV